MLSMFQSAEAFNQPLDSWDVSQVRVMNLMFYGANSFNQALDSWNVPQVIDMTSVFLLASAFNQKSLLLPSQDDPV